MTRAGLISQDELMEATGFKQRGALEKHLRKEKIPFHFGKGGAIYTTIDALNASLGIIESQTANSDEVEFI